MSLHQLVRVAIRHILELLTLDTYDKASYAR